MKDKDRELIRKSLITKEEFERLSDFKQRTVYQGFWLYHAVKVLEELNRDFPNNRFVLKFMIVELQGKEMRT